MRCAMIDDLIDRYADGRLDADLASAVAEHEAGCPRCARRIAESRRIAETLAGQPRVRAPAALTDRIMDAVYRAALAGARDTGQAAEPDRAEGAREAARLSTGRAAYRRLGLSFMLAAAVLTAGLALPRSFYPAQFRADSVAAGLSRDGSSPVKAALDGAGRAVQAALGKGGMSR